MSVAAAGWAEQDGRGAFVRGLDGTASCFRGGSATGQVSTGYGRDDALLLTADAQSRE